MNDTIREAIQQAKQRAKRDAMRNGTRQMILNNMDNEFIIAVNITTDLSKLHKWDNTLGRVLIKLHIPVMVNIDSGPLGSPEFSRIERVVLLT